MSGIPYRSYWVARSIVEHGSCALNQEVIALAKEYIMLTDGALPSCPHCSGILKSPCGECGGSGLVIGPYGESQVECPLCRGGKAK